jgi:hypothetical protein
MYSYPLGGRAKIRRGVVSTERLTFRIFEASVDLNGTFNLSDRTVHLLGNLHMQSDISHVRIGLKSLRMKRSSLSPKRTIPAQ